MKTNTQYIGRNILRFFTLILIAIGLIGCSNGEVKEVSFVQTSYEIKIDEEVDVLIRLKNVKKSDLVYESEEPKIAVFENGVLKGISVGKTVISVMVKDQIETKSEIYVEVMEPQKQKFTITYFLNGGINSPENVTTYQVDELPLTIHPATREHYTFKGWYVNAAYVSEPVNVINAETNSDIRLYALWEPVEYTVTFQGPDGFVNPNRQSYTILDLPFNLQAATLSGHIFKGWYLDEAFTNSVNSVTMNLIGDVTIYAKFEKAYSITYHLNAGSLGEPINTFSASDLGTDLPIPTRDGYTFEGWYDNPNFTGEKVTQISSEENLVVFAKWSGGESENPITYNLNGGTLPEDVVKVYHDGETITLPIPTRDDATFAGWYLDKDFNTFEITEITAGSGGRVTVYARWEFEVTYTVEQDTTTISVFYGDKLVQPEEPTKDGFIFVGWFVTENEQEKKFNFDTAITKKINLFAKFDEQVVEGE